MAKPPLCPLSMRLAQTCFTSSIQDAAQYLPYLLDGVSSISISCTSLLPPASCSVLQETHRSRSRSKELRGHPVTGTPLAVLCPLEEGMRRTGWFPRVVDGWLVIQLVIGWLIVQATLTRGRSATSHIVRLSRTQT